MTFRRLVAVFIGVLLASVPAMGATTLDGNTIAFEPSSSVPSSRIDQVASSLTHLQAKALSLVGIRYRYGGSNPRSGFDCSGFVQYVLRTATGLRVGRTAASQAGAGLHVARDQLQIGDLVFFNTRGRKYSHVGIYLGDGQFVHAPSSGGSVRVEDLDMPYWRVRYTTAERLDALDSNKSGAPERGAGLSPNGGEPRQSWNDPAQSGSGTQ